MAGADYFHCDVCGEKTSYDANLNWDTASVLAGRDDLPVLDNVGDIAVVCTACVKTHKVVVVEREKR